MKRAVCFLLVLVLFVLVMTSCVPTVVDTMTCIDFAGVQVGATFGSTVVLGGVQFSALGPRDLFVNNVTPSVHGLVFDNDGVQIDLSGPTSEVSLSAGAWFPQSLQIAAKNSDSITVYGATDPADNSLHDYSLGGIENEAIITTIVITGGGGEGVLVEICWVAN